MTSAFDDDDFRGNFVNVNDFEEEDDDVMDNWEDVLDEEEEAEKKKQEKEAEEERKRLEREEKLAKRVAEKEKQEQIQRLMNAKPLSKEEQEKAQLKAAEAAANDLFGFDDDRPADTSITVASLVTSTAGLSLNNPDSVDTYVPVDPEDFAELSRRIVKKLKNYQSDDGYISFIRDLIPELCSEMTSDDIKKISTPLVTLTYEKSRQEKEAKKKAQQASSKKTSLNVAKKQTDTRSDFLLNEYKSMDNYDDYDDLDDFM